MSDEIKRKIDELQKRYNAVVQRKAGLSGQLQAKKEELARIVQEIRAAGYDPKKIAQERDNAKQDLENLIVKLEGELTEVEKALSTFQQQK
jgi:septal ring factor EnvC (AmiA/AmiB activator)